MTIQTSNHKLRKQALAEGIDYNNFVKYGIALEASSAQAQSIEKAEQSFNYVDRKGNRRAYETRPAHKTDDRPGKVCDFTDQGRYVTFVDMIKS